MRIFPITCKLRLNLSSVMQKMALNNKRKALLHSSRCNKTMFNNFQVIVSNRPFSSSPGPLYQNEVKCSAFGMEIIFHSHANKTHFHKKGCALGLISKVRVFGTRKWLINRS